ncbi:hypothetical protein GCM10018980_62170 [Streptomyces capoamus]|uniref:Uncharacterized protein n=1 Tax=Streptomyces capoamus TaxID=68183 RepID=A0A919F1G5_9ACTN|nr:hypothetical protein GCM10018980_62170 [Streptomyces capoamus]
MRRGAHRQPHPGGPALRQVHGDLRARVADPDDEHVTVPVGRGVAVVAGVQQLAAVSVPARPVGQPGGVVEAGGDHHRAAGQLPAAGGVQQPAGAVPGALDAVHLHSGDDLQRVVFGVLLQVAHQVVPGHPAAEPAGYAQAGQCGQPSGGVQVQPVVVPPPGGADPVGLLQDHGPDAPGPQRLGDGEAARAGADDVDRAVGGDRRAADGRGAGDGHERERNHTTG